MLFHCLIFLTLQQNRWRNLWMDFTSREVTLRDSRITYETSLYSPRNSLLRYNNSFNYKDWFLTNKHYISLKLYWMYLFFIFRITKIYMLKKLLLKLREIYKRCFWFLVLVLQTRFKTTWPIHKLFRRMNLFNESCFLTSNVSYFIKLNRTFHKLENIKLSLMAPK